MKELTTEEKAKRYDEAIKLVNSRWHYKDKPCFIQASEIFPELKELKDEEIKKWLIGYFQQYKSDGIEEFGNGLKVVDVIAWLERQGDQKSTIKVEIKFKIGDWVVYNNRYESIYQVEKIEDGYYILRHTNGGTFRTCIIHDKDLRLWTLQDTKDGDVLAFNDNTIVIFKDLYNDTTFHSYCHIEDETFDVRTDELPDWWEGEGFHPATKEQREHLFIKLKEAGYRWNENKKELIKL